MAVGLLMIFLWSGLTLAGLGSVNYARKGITGIHQLIDVGYESHCL